MPIESVKDLYFLMIEVILETSLLTHREEIVNPRALLNHHYSAAKAGSCLMARRKGAELYQK